MRSLKIIISVVMLSAIILLTFRFLNPTQKDSSFELVKLNDVNNKNGFLWADAYIDTSWFVIPGIYVKNTSNKESVDISVLEYNNDNIAVNAKSISLFVKDIPSSQINKNQFTLYCSDIKSLEGGNLEVGIIAKGKEDDAYRYCLDIKYHGFKITENANEKVRFEIDVNNQSSSLAVFFIILTLIIIVSSLCWFLLLKEEYFPTFSRKGQLNISDPEQSTIFLKKNARKLILGSNLKEKESIFTKLFLGEIQYVLQGSNHSAIIIPYKDWKSKKILYRLSCKGETDSEIINEESYLKHLDKYKLRTNDEIISFEYFNIKHY